jgi:hypothetical protein
MGWRSRNGHSILDNVKIFFSPLKHPEPNQPGPKADYSPPSSADVKNAWLYTSTPPSAFMAGCLIKHRNKFTT